MRVAAERIGWKENKTEEVSEEMKEAFGSLYGPWRSGHKRECTGGIGVRRDWIATVTELAIENIIPPIRGNKRNVRNQGWGPEGVNAISSALQAAEDCARARRRSPHLSL